MGTSRITLLLTLTLTLYACGGKQDAVTPATIDAPESGAGSAASVVKGKAPEPAAKPAKNEHPELNLSYVPPTGLVRIHYDARFTLEKDSEDLTFLNPAENGRIADASLVAVITNPDPISQEVARYATVLQGAREKALSGYSLLSTTPGKCFRDITGVETRWVFDEPRNGKPKQMNGRACAFIYHHHGFSLMYAFDPKTPDDEAKLRSVVDAVELLGEDGR